ncbi:lipocalin family protein [Chryseobacterium sp. POL2]|nr:lipocalin family protein [Chryseobacterium sp. POL2]
MNFSLFGGGTAQSDTMSTLLYERWSVEGNQLTLTAKSIGNKQSSIDSKIYFIQKLNDKELVLKDKMQLLNYKKVNTKSQQKSKPKRTIGFQS